jgi:hypothetical protein
MKNVAFRGCDLSKAGWLVDGTSAPVVVDLADFDLFNITIELLIGSMSGSQVQVQYSNHMCGPWVDFDSVVHLDNTKRTSGLVGHVGRLVRLYVSSTPGGTAIADVYYHVRGSNSRLDASAGNVVY